MMAEETWHLTPYQFGGNDPISYNDPTGLLYNLGMSNKGSATPILDGWNTGADQMARADRPDPWGNLYGGSSGGGITPIYDDKGQVIGLNLGAQAAQAFTRAFQYAYNHPNDQGEWSVSFGTNEDGIMGYWMPYTFDPKEKGDGKHNLDGVGAGTRFVRYSDDPGKESMEEVAANIIKGNLWTFLTYIMNKGYGAQFFIKSIENYELKTGYKDLQFLPDPIVFAMKAAEWGHHYFPGDVNSTARHIIGAFSCSEKYGPAMALLLTSGNEVVGFFRQDIPNLVSRLKGESNWAFKIDDFKSNLIGIFLSYIF